MSKDKFFRTTVLCILLLGISCVSEQKHGVSLSGESRCPAQVAEEGIRLIPQEVYGEEVLDLLARRGQDGVTVLQFNFFTDNREDSYPKQIARRLADIRRQHPTAPMTVALESRKDADDPSGRGAAQ